MAKFDAKAKAKRQKIVAAVLGVLLLGVLVYEVPSVLKMMHKKPAPAPSAAPAPVAVPAAGVPAAGTPVSAVSGSASLVDSDPAAQAAPGQLISFDRFVTKDPFVQPAVAAATATAAAGTPAPTVKTASPKPAAPRPAPTPAPGATEPPAPAPAGSSATISVNGETETVEVKGTFPQSDPVFVLVSVTRKTAKIGIAGGSLETGDETVTLTKGKKVTLMNTADGTRYELVLVSVS